MAEPTDKDTRGPTNLRIKFRSANLDEFIQRYAVDVSRGGIFIRTREPLSVDTRLKLDFQLLEAQPLFEGEGTVVWIRQPDATRAEVTPGMGVRFDKLNPESQARLERILSEKERLGQTGKGAGLNKSAGGMAVRRPTGAFAAVDPAAAKPAPPPLPGAMPPAPPPARPSAPPIPPMGSAGAPPAAAPRLSPFAAGAAGRPRATTGAMSAFRSAPNPSAVFEQPTAEDIDNALSVLEDKPGPVPAPPPPPRLSQDAPIHVADDASNEPTRVSDLQEFAANEAVTGRAAVLPESGQEGLPDSAIPELQDHVTDETARAVVEEEATIAASPAAFAAGERAATGGMIGKSTKSGRVSVDALLGDQPLGGVPEAVPPAPPLGPSKKVIIEGPMPPTESGRFRTNATYRRPSKMGKRVAAVLVLVAAAGGAYALRDRLSSLISPPKVTVAPLPPSPPEPATQPEAGVAAAGAVDASAVAVGPAVDASAAPPVVAEPQKPAPTGKPGVTEKPGKVEAKATPEDERPKKKRLRPAASEGAAPVVAEKPPAAEGAEPKPAPEGEQKPAPNAETPAPTLPDTAAPPPAASPLLKVTSSPPGADVLIDGTPVGTTPFSSKAIDATASHAITVKKDGYDPQDRAIAAGDWTKGKGGASLKVNVKLRRSAGAAQPPAEPAKEAKPEVEILTPGD